MDFLERRQLLSQVVDVVAPIDATSTADDLPTSSYSVISNIALDDGRVLFPSTSREFGVELFITDGKASGTHLLSDLNPGTGSSDPSGFRRVGDTIYFAATDPTHGRELWTTDGTAAGTRLLKDINPGSATSNATAMVQLGNKVIFSANDGVHGNEPWVSDGTKGGTTMLLDISPTGGSLSSPQFNVASNGVTFTTQMVSGFPDRSQVWGTDGTSAGTRALTSYEADVSMTKGFTIGSYAYHLVGRSTGPNMVRSDGTLAGTSVIPLDYPTAGGTYVPFADSFLVWRNVGSQPGTITRVPLDGSTATLLFTGDLYRDVGAPIVSRDHFFFSYFTGAQLYGSDGTVAGTTLLISSAFYSGAVYPIGNGKAFIVPGGNDRQPLLSDGTLANTVPIGSHLVSYVGEAAKSDSPTPTKRYFTVNTDTIGRELFQLDTVAETFNAVPEIRPGVDSTSPELATAVGNRVVYLVPDPVFGAEPWISDGTADGTRSLGDLNTSLRGATLKLLTGDSSRLYYWVYKGVSGSELYYIDQNDPTKLSTRVGNDLYPVRSVSSESDEAYVPFIFGGRYYFPNIDPENSSLNGWSVADPSASTPVATFITGYSTRPVIVGDQLYYTTNTALWVSDGTAASTRKVRDFTQTPGRGIALADRLYFVATDTTAAGSELWTSDGTAAGTTVVKDLTLQTNVGSGPNNLIELDGKLIFTASERVGSSDVSGIYQTDGTSAGTQRLATVPGNYASAPPRVAKAGKFVFFTLSNVLYRSDGTASGTFSIAKSTGFSALSANRTAIGNVLYYFSGSTSLWASDGTVAGTALLTPLTALTGGSTHSLAAVNGQLLVSLRLTVSSSYQLYVGDGSAYLQPVAAIDPASTVVSAAEFTAFDDRAVFIGTDNRFGRDVLSLTRDTTAPTILSGAFDVNASLPTFNVQWSDSIADSLHASAVSITNLTTGEVLSPDRYQVAYDYRERRSLIRAADANAFPDGRYRIVIQADGLTRDTAGNVVVDSATYEFRLLRGDANQDGVVDFNDLVILTQNYNLTGRNFRQGNFNFSADGLVDFADLVLLAQRYGTTLAVVSANSVGMPSKTHKNSAIDIFG